MIKKEYFQLLYNILIGLAVLVLAFCMSFKNGKTGYLDFEILLRQYKGTKAMGEAFENKTKIFRDNVDTLTAELNRSFFVFESKQKALSALERNAQKEELEKRKTDLIRYREAVNAKMQEEQEKMLDELSKEIRDYLKEYSKENHYRIVLFKTENTIAYGEEECDITAEVLKGLNAKYVNKK